MLAVRIQNQPGGLKMEQADGTRPLFQHCFGCGHQIFYFLNHYFYIKA